MNALFRVNVDGSVRLPRLQFGDANGTMGFDWSDGDAESHSMIA